ncbi:MAG: hypothetical protein DRG30_03170 [Epsilonproteobacteria bacterium]|nr:MAG: hypothetical protein DRG30_03170 [Campylobacterota bacterium]
MLNLDIVLTLVFSIVMLIFMIFPAMKITEWIESKIEIPEKWHNYLMFVITLLLALAIGLFLRFA